MCHNEEINPVSDIGMLLPAILIVVSELYELVQYLCIDLVQIEHHEHPQHLLLTELARLVLTTAADYCVTSLADNNAGEAQSPRQSSETRDRDVQIDRQVFRVFDGEPETWHRLLCHRCFRLRF